VLVGRGTRGLTLLGFYPSQLHVHVGEVVRFVWAGENETHNVVFGSESLIDSLRGTLLSGPAVDPVGGLPSEPPGSGVPSLTQGTHGNGFLDSGLMPDASPGLGPSFSVRFAQAANYHFGCLIHASMNGDVTVS
jgi:plastocyanin